MVCSHTLMGEWREGSRRCDRDEEDEEDGMGMERIDKMNKKMKRDENE